MKTIFTTTIILLLISCSGILSKKDIFVGDWVMSKSSPHYKESKEAKSIIIKITKNDIFYNVVITINDKNVMDDIGKGTNEKKAIDILSKYQLSPDKKSLLCIGTPELYYTYNEDNNTITNGVDWFIKK